MSLKQFYTEESQIPAELKDYYRKSGERYEIQIDGVNSISAVLDKNTELLKEKADWKRERDDAVSAKTDAELERDNYKNNPKLPKGQRLVSIEDFEIVEAAKTEGLTKESIAELKAKAEKSDTLETEILNEKVADAAGKDKAAWLDHARANSLKFDTRKETVDGKEQDYFVVVGADNAETKISDYVSTKAAHVKDADTKDEGTYFARQRSSDGDPPRASAATSYINSTYKRPDKQAA